MKPNFKAAIPLTILGLFAAGTANATMVDCSAGETIAAALNGNGKTINIKGVCSNEPDALVTIAKDDVTLAGITPDATIEGTVSIEGANRAVIENLTITAPGDGIYVSEGGSATIRNSVITGNDSIGILVFNGAYAMIEFNEITGNGEDGIAVTRGGTVRSRENVIAGHSFAGVEVTQHGAFASQPRSGEAGDAITAAPGPFGVVASRHSYVDLRDFTIDGNIRVTISSELDMRGRSVRSVVNGDISADTLSVVIKNNSRAGVTVNGDCWANATSYCNGF